jgi:NAD(P)-dependent dehydrogenase (short-subunit alcohol dehydrogenase family)
MEANDKVLLVTGGTRGVGAAVARLAASRGWSVGIGFRQDTRAADALVGEITASGGRALACPADVGVESEVARLFAEVDASLGPVAAMVCNARAASSRLPVEHMDEARLRQGLDTGIVGSLLCVREAVRRMAPSGMEGSIVFVSPETLPVGNDPEAVDEAVLRAAREAMTVSLAKELQRAAIRVNLVRPAVTRTTNWSGGVGNRTTRSIGPMAMELGPYAIEAAKQILWLISGEADRTTGAIVEVPCQR